MVTLYIAIGLVIFLFYMVKGGQDKSLEITMHLGLAITLLALAIDLSFNPVLQVSIVIMTVLLLLQKGFT
jgi:hypothetical protein